MYFVQGPLYPVKVKFVSQKTLDKRAGKGRLSESTRGLFKGDDNQIFVLSSISEEEKLHILLHELVHAAEHQVSGQEEETRVDTLAKWIASLAKFTNVSEILT